MPKLEELIKELCPNGVQFYELRDVFDMKNGYTPSKANASFWENGTIPWFRMEDIRENGCILSDSLQHITPEAVKGNLFPANSIIVATSATIGEHALITVQSLANQRFTYLTPKKEYIDRINPMYMYYYCFKLDEWCLNNTNISSFASVDMTKFARFKVPVPPLPVQEEIVRILDSFTELTAELTARKKQYEYYRERWLTTISNEQIAMCNLGDICDVSAGSDAPKDDMSIEKTETHCVPIISNGIGENAIYGYTSSPKITVPAVTVAARGTIGYAEYRDYPYYPIIRLLSVIPKDSNVLYTKYLYYTTMTKSIGL